ncbi:MAG TPA: XRE family transcriptional regulator [bacterium]|jgi:transcriptional regulator with XRE-family HTH domain/Zn-dependent peptidase ImmA (M78 family)
MIKNDRQYRITKSELAKFEDALKANAQAQTEGPKPSWLTSLENESFRDQIEELREEVAEYEALKAASPGVIEVHSFDELPQALIKARIASGLSQQELADRLGIKEQQVQRYEATDYAGANLERIQQVVDALGIKIEKKLLLPAPHASVGFVFKRLSELGLSKSFVVDKLLPNWLQNQISDAARLKAQPDTVAHEFASWLSRIFNWTSEDIFSNRPLQPQLALSFGTKYKKASNVTEQQVSLYTVYAHYLAMLALQCTDSTPIATRSLDPVEVHESILARYGVLDLASITEYVWDCGLAVLPLKDAGYFHGAYWRIDGRDIAVVKQNVVSASRWMIDLLHEYYHAASHTDEPDVAVIEQQDILMPGETPESEEEADATWFAVAVMLNGRPEELLQECVTEARGQVPWLKRAVPQVAERNQVDVGVLANYLAYRLSQQGTNWWPTANALQVTDINPWSTVRSVLLRNLRSSCMDESNEDVFIRALSEA